MVTECMGLCFNVFAGLPSSIIQCMGLSFNVFVEKVQVVAMLDDGATHNFITPSLIARRHIQT